MLNRYIIIAFTAILCATSIQAQEQEVKKPRLYIEEFNCAEGLSGDMCNMLRMNIISALNATERFEITDAKSQASLDDEAIRRASVSAMADEAARTEEIVTKANNYILRGSLLSCSTQSTVVDGKTRHTYGLGYSIVLVDASNSTDVASKTFSHGALGTQTVVRGTGGKLLNQLGTYATAEDAINGGMSHIEDDVENFLIEYLPLEGKLLAEDYEVKRGKIDACYINIGSGLGVKEGDYFAIMTAQVRAGRVIYQEIGRLKVKEVLDETLSYCEITKDGKEVYEAMEEYQTMAADDPDTQPLIVRSTTAPLLAF